jgi:hypothetical protein
LWLDSGLTLLMVVNAERRPRANSFNRGAHTRETSNVWRGRVTAA